MLSEEVAQICRVVFWLFCFFDDDPEEILAPQPIVVAAPSRRRTAQAEWSRSVTCHLPEPTAFLLRRGLPSPVVGPSRARGTCLVAGQARNHCQISFCSWHKLLSFQKSLNKVFPSAHRSLGPGFYYTSVGVSRGCQGPQLLLVSGRFFPGEYATTIPLLETLPLVPSLHLWLQILTPLRLDPGSCEVGQLL